MPSISNDTIRQLYELYGNDDYPVDMYCINCTNCEYFSFPCLNCAEFVFNGQLGPGNGAAPEIMDIDEPVVSTSEEVNMIPSTPEPTESNTIMDVDSDDDCESVSSSLCLVIGS